MKIELIRAWPHRFERIELELPSGSVIADALRLVPPGDEIAFSIHGIRATADTPLAEGDRIELLRPLQADPKDSRRRRAEGRRVPR